MVAERLASLVGMVAVLLAVAPGSSHPSAHVAVPAAAGEVTPSQVCLGCHDGTIARDVLVRDVTLPFTHAGAGSVWERERRAGHPIGSDYGRLASDRRARLRRPAFLDPAIKLEDGRVGCLSCHDLGSPRRARLAVIGGGSLCLACHDL